MHRGRPAGRRVARLMLQRRGDQRAQARRYERRHDQESERERDKRSRPVPAKERKMRVYVCITLLREGENREAGRCNGDRYVSERKGEKEKEMRARKNSKGEKGTDDAPTRRVMIYRADILGMRVVSMRERTGGSELRDNEERARRGSRLLAAARR